MAQIIKLDTSRRRPPRGDEKTTACRHGNVTAWTAYRTVNCSYCGAELDPFDVLVDMIKGYIPAGRDRAEEHRFAKEAARRQGSGPKKNPETD